MLISWMVTLTLCLIWLIVLSFRPTNMVVYTFEQHWQVGLRSTDKRCRFCHLLKKITFSDGAHFWSCRICKQAKLSHLGHRKPARILWKAEATKTSHCLVRILVSRHYWAICLRKWARRGRCSQWPLLSSHVQQIFCHKNWRGGYWQHLFSTGRRYVHTVDVLRHVSEELMSFG